MSELVILRARFDHFTALKEALKKLKERGFGYYEAYGPINLTDVQDLMPTKGSPVRILATVGAATGLFSLWYLVCIRTSQIYNIVVGGKPPISNVPYVIPGYEGTILVGSLGAFLAAIAVAHLTRRAVPREYDVRFSEDEYGVVVHCEPESKPVVSRIFEEAGALEIDELD